ncbi:MAG: hypothetical protein HY561_12250 [Gemmatimonadetes bacterium]|nr:hypothetical protein [Gemmatimonadota bacterium]
MKKLVLLALVAFAVARAIPATRPKTEPIVEWARAKGGPYARPVIDPVLRWSANDEARNIAHGLLRRDRVWGDLPHPSKLQQFIRRWSFCGDCQDPWGSPYGILVRSDSIIVWSLGPDRTSDTGDEIRTGGSRN